MKVCICHDFNDKQAAERHKAMTPEERKLPWGLYAKASCGSAPDCGNCKESWLEQKAAPVPA